jgi:hypothetical protein
MCGAEMEFKGAASLHNPNINVLKNVYGGLDLRVERINQNIGRVYVVDQNGNAQQLPINAQGNPVITMADRVNANVAPHNNEFLYVYADSYTVSVNGSVVMRLDQQKQHTIMAPKAIMHEKIEL